MRGSIPFGPRPHESCGRSNFGALTIRGKPLRERYTPRGLWSWLRSSVAIVAVGALVGCARSAPPPRRAQTVSHPRNAAETVTVPRTIVTPTDAHTLLELYDRAYGELQASHFARAAVEFDRIFGLDPTWQYAPDSLFQAAIAHEQDDDRETALSRFEELARRFPEHPLGREALVRCVRLLAFLERWKRLGEVSDLLLLRHHDLRPFESVVAHGGKALSLVMDAGDVDGASFYIEKGRNVIDDNGLDQAGRVSRDLAQLYFALGEVRRIRAERIRFVPVPENFPAVLEERAQLLLDAQSAYSDAMRAYDAHWSAMAGYRVGELYRKLHSDLMSVPPPKSAGTDVRKQQLFEGAMRLRYSILLKKALSMMEHTISMAERTGERSDWVTKALASKKAIEQSIHDEDAAIARLPYTKAELQAALDDLARKGRTKGHASDQSTRKR